MPPEDTISQSPTSNENTPLFVESLDGYGIVPSKRKFDLLKFLIRTAAKLASIPFSILSLIAGFLSPSASETLIMLAWRINHDPGTAVQALAKHLQLNGIESACKKAASMMQVHPSPALAAFAGLIESDLNNQDKASEYFKLAKQGNDESGLVDVLELRQGSSRDQWASIERMKSRKDLSPLAKRFVLEMLMYEHVEKREQEDAVAKAKYLLSIDNNPSAEVVMWGWHLSKQNMTKAKECETRFLPTYNNLTIAQQMLVSRCFRMENLEQQLRHKLEEIDPQLSARILEEVQRVETMA